MRKGLSVFTVCLIISIALWIMIRLTGEFKETIIYPVNYTHHVKNKIIIDQPDKFLAVTYKVKGFDLTFNKYLRKRKTLTIDLGKLLLVKDGEDFKTEINTSKYNEQIAEQLNIPDETISINPDTVSLYFTNIYHKKVPVKVNLSLSFDKQFELYKNIIYKPDSITITGIKKETEKINYVETEFKVLKDLRKNEYLSLKIMNPKSLDNVNISPNRLEVFIPVEKYTEGTVIVPLTVLNSTKGKTLKTFPDKIQITYLVAMNDYPKVKPDMFEAVVDYLNAKKSKTNKISVSIITKPEFIRLTRFKPDKVEFIIW